MNAMNAIGAALGVLAALGIGASAAAFPARVTGPATAQMAGLAVALPELRKALAEHLTRPEVERLLAKPEVQRALTAVFEGWDGNADRLAVREKGGVLRVEVQLGYRRCVAALTFPEGAPPAPVCTNVDLPDAERSLDVSSDAWTPPARPARPPPPVVARVAPAGVEDRAPRGPPASVMREAGATQPATEPAATGPVAVVDRALAGHDAFRDRLRKLHWKDPMLPENLLETGTALAPLAENPTIVEEAVDYHLKNPFDEARMRTEIPVPDMLTLGVSVAEPLVPSDRAECTQAWADRASAAEPPTLDCFRRTAWNKALSQDKGYQVLDFLARYLQPPLLGELRDLIAKNTTTKTAHRLVWVFVYLDWLQLHPNEAASALAKLDPEERRLLRRRLADLWVQHALGPYRATITHLFESHFVLLYPEARDLDGLPRRAFFPYEWLWATNWLAGATEREDALIVQAYGRLGADERRLVDALVSDARFAPRFQRVSAVLRASNRSEPL